MEVSDGRTTGLAFCVEVPDDFVLASPVSFEVALAEDVVQAFFGALGPPPPALLEE